MGGADFDGSWNNRGVIRGNVLTWLDGPTTRVLYTSATSLAVVLGDITYNGELLGDGRLLWDDGDVWTRQSFFDGLWSNRGLIDGNILKWTDGPPTRPVIKGQTLEVELDGHTFHGELRADGRLHWDDGDVWERHILAVGDIIQAKAAVEFMVNGTEIFGAGDEGIVTRVGENTFDVAWKRTGMSSAYYVKSFANAFKLISEASKCNFSKFDQVVTSEGTRGVPKGQVGNVVGFTQDLVEVQFQSCICKCLPDGLRHWKHNAGSSREQSCMEKQKLPTIPQPRSIGNTRRVTSAQLEERTSKCKAIPVVLASRAADAAIPSEIPIDSKRYEGVVWWSRGSMAWISCKALAARFPGYDVFLHKNNCDAMPKQKERVSFRLTLDLNGNPKALRATIQREGTQ